MLTIPELQAHRVRPARCPHCGETLAPIPLVIASRCCPRCGQTIVTGSEANAFPPPFTRSQLDAACEGYKRTRVRAAWTLFAAYGVLWTGLLIWNWLNDPKAPLPYPGLWLMLLAWLPCGAMVIWGIKLFRRANRQTLKCPHCANPCSGCTGKQLNLTQLTGNCGHCGRALVHLPPGQPPGPLPPVAEFKPAASRHFWWGGVGLFALLAVYLTLNISVARWLDATFQDVIRSEFSLQGGDLKGASQRIRRAMASLLFGGLAAMGGFMAVGVYCLHRLRRRRLQLYPILSCPHCLAELTPMSRVIACKRCPRCCVRVLANRESSGVATETSVE
jgi:hypothetical protein